MRIFLPTMAGLLVTAVIAVAVIGLNSTRVATVGLNAEARARGLTAQLQRQADQINRAADDTAGQERITTNQALAFPTAAGQVVIPAGTTLRILRHSGADVVVQYNGIEVNLPGWAIDSR